MQSLGVADCHYTTVMSCALLVGVARSTDIRQPEEADRVHVNKQRGRDGGHDDVHHCRNPTADGSSDHPLRGPRHRPSPGHLAGDGKDGNERDDAYAT